MSSRRNQSRTPAQEAAYATLYGYLSDPSMPWGNIRAIAMELLDVDADTLDSLLDAATLASLRTAALKARRSNYQAELTEVDLALFARARGGDLDAIKLVYQRFEGWVPITHTQSTSTINQETRLDAAYHLSPEIESLLRVNVEERGPYSKKGGGD